MEMPQWNWWQVITQFERGISYIRTGISDQ